MNSSLFRKIACAATALLSATHPAIVAAAGPAEIVAAAPLAEWQAFAPADLLVVDLASGARVVIALALDFAPVHVANIRALARAGRLDAGVVQRVQDNYVTQWGDAEEGRPLPSGVVAAPPPEYVRPAAPLALVALGYRDSYAPEVGYVGAFPVAREGGEAWLTHCYGMVGVGRGASPDTGIGTELYAVIGHAPRALDRNIALVGRVVSGMEGLSALPRGTAEMGFYADRAGRPAIRRVRMAADLPPNERPAFQWLRPEGASFKAFVAARANRRDDFFQRPAGAVDLCNALPPVRKAP